MEAFQVIFLSVMLIGVFNGAVINNQELLCV